MYINLNLQLQPYSILSFLSHVYHAHHKNEFLTSKNSPKITSITKCSERGGASLNSVGLQCPAFKHFSTHKYAEPFHQQALPLGPYATAGLWSQNVLTPISYLDRQHAL
uniref:Uncharacterized protein n=1 Tax=Anguilla anguilla TaxID=7936 RepID=A0A0E9SQB2_ANGAN